MGRKKMREKKVFTTKEVGDFCGVDLTTVINWIEQGKMNAYKTAGGHRRGRKKELREFMEKYSMPLPPELRDENGAKILVVDDDPNILSLITQALKRLPSDYKLATAADGFEAGQKLVSFNPDLVILDLRLPGMDGYKVIETIKKGNGTGILAITAYDDKETEKKALTTGADSYLSKPFTIENFMSKVKSLLK